METIWRHPPLGENNTQQDMMEKLLEDYSFYANLKDAADKKCWILQRRCWTVLDITDR